MIVLNATFNNFLINVQVTEQSISNTEVTTDNIGMFYHNYDTLLTSVLNSFVYDFNYSHQTGIDLKQKYPVVKFVAGMIQKSIITPF